MKSLVTLAAGCVVALTPALAPAALQLRLERLEFMPVPGPYGMDVFAVGTDNEDEQLGGYDLAFRLVAVNPSPVSGVGFAPPFAVRPAEGFVFGAPDPTRYTYNVPPNGPPAAGPTQFLLNVESTGAGPVDIVSAVKIAEIVLDVQPGTLPGRYRVEINEQVTNFGSLDPTRLDPAIEYTISTDPDSGLIDYIPEPSAAALLAPAGLLALRRRRRPAG